MNPGEVCQDREPSGRTVLAGPGNIWEDMSHGIRWRMHQIRWVDLECNLREDHWIIGGT